jgi:hypothetical protein
MKKKAKKIIDEALLFLLPEWDCLHKEIMATCLFQMMKECCKGGCKEGKCAKACPDKGECKKGGECPCEDACKCDKECDPECCVKIMCKKFVGSCKDIIKERIELILCTFKKLIGHDIPPLFGKHKKFFLKTVAVMLRKMYECSMCCQGKCTKECYEKIAEAEWKCAMKKICCFMKKKTKKIAEKAVFYCCPCDCPQFCKDAAVKSLAKVLRLKCLISKKMNQGKCCGEEKKECPEKKCPQEDEEMHEEGRSQMGCRICEGKL